MIHQIETMLDGFYRKGVIPLNPPKAGVNGAIFCPGDVPRVMTTCLDGQLRIWDCRNGEMLISLKGHQGLVKLFLASFFQYLF